jgi:hypothetical protein
MRDLYKPWKCSSQEYARTQQTNSDKVCNCIHRTVEISAVPADSCLFNYSLYLHMRFPLLPLVLYPNKSSHKLNIKLSEKKASACNIDYPSYAGVGETADTARR